MSKKTSSPFSPWSTADAAPDADPSATSSSDGNAALDTAAADLSAAAAQLQDFASQMAASPGSANPVTVNVTVTGPQGEILPSSMETDGPDLSLLS